MMIWLYGGSAHGEIARVEDDETVYRLFLNEYRIDESKNLQWMEGMRVFYADVERVELPDDAGR